MSNQVKFDESADSVLPGKEGVRHDGALYRQAKDGRIYAETAKNHLESLQDRWAAGKSGVRFDGELFGMLRRTEANTAVFQNLVKALANVSGGEKFDQDKLLAGIAKTVFDNSKAGAEAGTAAAIDGIDTTVTIKQEDTK